MIELSNTRRLTIGVAAFILLIIIGFITFRKPAFVYGISTQEMLNEMNRNDGQISLNELQEILTTDEKSVVFVDLRSPYDFEKSSLENAVNIPVSDILTKENVSFFEDMKKESKEVIIYGDDYLTSNSIWMILRQLGFGNTRVILQDYNILFQNLNNVDDLQVSDNKLEIQVVDFAGYIKSNTGSSIEAPDQKKYTKQVIPTRRKKKTSTAGGC